MSKIKAIAITGPTASGKTSLGINLAIALCGEIISLDSMQIYRGMDIGTAKATEKERAAIPHHMIDIIPPSTPYSAHDYKDDALRAAEDIISRGKIPIFVGGTGLYLDTLRRRGAEEVPPASPEYRRELLALAENDGGRELLHKRLCALDPKSAETIHPNNVKRVIRALEVCESTGRPKSELDAEAALPDPRIDILHITLDFHNRDTLYERTDERVQIMFDMGLSDEVLGLLDSGALTEDSTAALAIGYKEIVSAVRLGLAPESAMEEIKQATRNYAKRQLTWFRHDQTALRIFADREPGGMREPDELLSECLAKIEKSGLLSS